MSAERAWWMVPLKGFETDQVLVLGVLRGLPALDDALIVRAGLPFRQAPMPLWLSRTECHSQLVLRHGAILTWSSAVLI